MHLDNGQNLSHFFFLFPLRYCEFLYDAGAPTHLESSYVFFPTPNWSLALFPHFFSAFLLSLLCRSSGFRLVQAFLLLSGTVFCGVCARAKERRGSLPPSRPALDPVFLRFAPVYSLSFPPFSFSITGLPSSAFILHPPLSRDESLSIKLPARPSTPLLAISSSSGDSLIYSVQPFSHTVLATLVELTIALPLSIRHPMNEVTSAPRYIYLPNSHVLCCEILLL